MVRWLWALAVLAALGCASNDVDEQIGAARQPILLGAPQKLTALVPAGNAFFGHAVAVDGETLMVGTNWDNATSQFEGVAYVFVNDGASWSQQAALNPSGMLDYAEFGAAVAIKGNTAAIGAPGLTTILGPLSAEQGAVFIFNRTGTIWVQSQRLTAPDEISSARFGDCVSLDGDTLLIGASYTNAPNAADHGAYVFVRNTSTWEFQQELIGSTGQLRAQVALHGDTAVVAANGLRAGADVFVRTGTVWSFQQRIATADTEDSFTEAVALFGDTAILGSPTTTVGNTPNVGAAYVFTRSGTTWTERKKLVLNGPTERTRFGTSVALHSGVAVVGANWDDVDTNTEQGSVTIFAGAGTVWNEENYLTDFNGDESEYFGEAVAFDGQTVVAGFPSDNAPIDDSGSAVVYNVVTAQGGSSGTAGAAQGGTAGAAQGGTAGAAQGGTAGAAQGGTSGAAQGGTAGSGGAATGGDSGASQGGTAGAAQGGSGGTDGSAGNTTAGTGGATNGGTTGSGEAGAGPGSDAGADGGPMSCIPGEQKACACSGGRPDGAQSCNADGNGYGTCDCTVVYATSNDDGGCGCRIPSRSPSNTALMAALLGVMALVLRRSRRSPAPPLRGVS